MKFENRVYRQVGLAVLGVLSLSLGLLDLGTLDRSAQAANPTNHQKNTTPVVEVEAIEKGGVKYWLPETIQVKKGLVKIHAVSKIPGLNNIHGFAIDEFKVQELVDGKGKTFEFQANKVGEFPIRCHLHPAHVGGKIIVTE